MNWTAHVHDLLAPLDNFSRLHAATVRRLGRRVVDLSYPNPCFNIDRRPYDLLGRIAAQINVEDLRYSPFGGFTTVRRVLAAALSRRHQLTYSFRDIILTPGAAAAINVALRALFQPPDRIVLVSPCWIDYPLYLASLGLGYDLVPTDRGKHLDLAGIERAWTPRTRAMILSQPVSPTGILYTDEELRRLAETLERLGQRHRYQPVLISDETHRDQIWSDARFHSPATVYPKAMCVYSFGKAWEMQGQRIGYLAVSPHWPDRHALSSMLEAGMRITGHCAPTSLMQHMAGALTDFTPELKPLAELQHHVRHRLRHAGYEIVDAKATRFVYAEAPTSDDIGFVTLLARHGVLAMPSTIFHESGYFRLAINVEGDALQGALDVLTYVRTKEL
ncbi:MAG: aminotransferase class I/II-fold pyridoxal phosphate-dependent enzyme [Pseudonocardiaceae bacterium]